MISKYLNKIIPDDDDFACAVTIEGAEVENDVKYTGVVLRPLGLDFKDEVLVMAICEEETIVVDVAARVRLAVKVVVGILVLAVELWVNVDDADFAVVTSKQDVLPGCKVYPA